MRILLIDSCCKYGSTGEIVYNLFGYVQKKGGSAAICYGRGVKIGEKNIYKFGLDAETYMHALLARITGLNGNFSYLSTKRLISWIERFKPDVIHIHELHAYFVNIKPLIEYIKGRKIPVVWTFHCEYMYTGKCGHAGECEKWKTGCYDCPAVKDYPKSAFFDRTARMYAEKKALLKDLEAVYVTPSPYFAERVHESFLKEKQVQVIYNGINTKIYYPHKERDIREELGIQEDKSIILSVAPKILSNAKGGPWILELAKKEKNSNREYVLVGDEEKITRLAENVTVVPLIRDREKLARIYSEADCFILCSTHETFSLTCAEALCCGVPVAGFRCGAPETIFESPWAEFVSYGDIESLKKMIDVQINRDRKSIAEYGRKKFDQEVMCEQYLAIYRKLAGEHL